MWKCPKCHEYRFTAAECHCKEFTVIDEDGEEHKAQAMDSEGAARKYAQKSNENRDYYLMNTTAVITIEGKKYEIGAEPDVHYSVNEI